jgi:hypothetical protein
VYGSRFVAALAVPPPWQLNCVAMELGGGNLQTGMRLVVPDLDVTVTLNTQLIG